MCKGVNTAAGIPPSHTMKICCEETQFPYLYWTVMGYIANSWAFCPF